MNHMLKIIEIAIIKKKIHIKKNNNKLLSEEISWNLNKKIKMYLLIKLDIW